MKEEIKEKPNYYSILSANVRYDTDLPPNAKLLYSEITSLCNQKGCCFATNNYFANLYNVDKATISRWIAMLVKKKYISIKILKNENNSIEKRLIFLGNIPIDKIINTCTQNNQYPIDEIVKYNNTSINSNNNIDIKELSEIDEQFEMSPEIFAEIFPIIEKEFGRLISPMEVEMIKTWNYPVEILKLAVSEASTNAQFSMRYIDKIIYNWKKANVRTVEDVKKYIKNFHERKDKNNLPSGQASSTGTNYGSYEVLS